MSSVNFLEKLLDGVAVNFLPLGDVTNYEQPTKYLVAAKNYSDNFDTPVLTAGKTFILGYTDEIEGIYRASEHPVIIFDDFTTANKWVDFDFKAKSSAMKMITSKENNKFLLKYIYYWLNTLPNELIDGDHKRQWIGNYSNKLIPIPCPENPKKSLEIQAEIVRILDVMTAHTAELTAELTARKKQYNYYRDKLLGFEDGGVEWKALKDIGEFMRGKRFTKEDYVENGIPVIHYGEIYTGYGSFAEKTLSQVRNDLEKKLRYAKSGDVVITDVGETVEDVGKAVAWLGKQDIAIHDHCYAFRHTMNPKFVAYCMQTSSFVAEKAKYVARTKVNTLLINGFSKIKIPVPSVEVQDRVVSMLEKFEALTSYIADGLPREIELREKQYAHYRNALLNFPRSEVVKA